MGATPWVLRAINARLKTHENIRSDRSIQAQGGKGLFEVLRGKGDVLPTLREPNGLEDLRGILRVGKRDWEVRHRAGDVCAVLGWCAVVGYKA